MTGANDRTGVGAGTAEWQTPPDLFARLNRRFQFDYDAFASHENALCDLYSTVDGTYRKLGPGRCAEAGGGDGLEFDWKNLRVFMNPPYSRGVIELCVRKAYLEKERAALIVALIPAATETQWFQRYVLPHCHIDWLPQRVHYVHPPFECGPTCQTRATPHVLGAPGDGPPGGSVVAVFKSDLMGRGEVPA
ncbi:MAG: DNA N-6-adenine-methyltransferase [Dehalococcoidia bacterium]